MPPFLYAQLFKLEECDHWGQLVLQCRVRPEAIVEKPGTLDNKYWPPHVRFDPNFESTEGLEWLLENPDDIVVYGLMMREFGSRASASVHGELVKRVDAVNCDPEFEWTRLRAEQFASQGLLIVR